MSRRAGGSRDGGSRRFATVRVDDIDDYNFREKWENERVQYINDE